MKNAKVGVLMTVESSDSINVSSLITMVGLSFAILAMAYVKKD